MKVGPQATTGRGRFWCTAQQRLGVDAKINRRKHRRKDEGLNAKPLLSTAPEGPHIFCLQSDLSVPLPRNHTVKYKGGGGGEMERTGEPCTMSGSCSLLVTIFGAACCVLGLVSESDHDTLEQPTT